MNTRLKDLYSHVAVLATADREHEAAIELLLLMMLADHHISEAEITEIRHISEDSGWRPTRSPRPCVGEADQTRGDEDNI
jgi:uncharacterized tellurite resistance protein B-like protein